MNTQYFCSPELSDKLQKLGVESQFDFWWEEDEDNEGDYDIYITTKPTIKDQKAYHWSDLCLPENAKKIWRDIEENGTAPWMVNAYVVLQIVSFGKDKFNNDWQSFLEEEVDKKLSERDDELGGVFTKVILDENQAMEHTVVKTIVKAANATKEENV